MDHRALVLRHFYYFFYFFAEFLGKQQKFLANLTITLVYLVDALLQHSCVSCDMSTIKNIERAYNSQFFLLSFLFQ